MTDFIIGIGLAIMTAAAYRWGYRNGARTAIKRCGTILKEKFDAKTRK